MLKLGQVLKVHVKVSEYGVRQAASSLQIKFWDPPLYLENEMRQNIEIGYAGIYLKVPRLHIKISLPGRLGESVAFTFYFWDPSKSPKLIELES